jgi:hypothetical protein
LRRQLILVALVVLALRLPFLNQALQGDDVLYLTEAAHAQIEPLHPKHTTYVFMGRDIDMRGQSHPPLNAWFLALLIAAGKGVSEIPFHAAYILFSLIAAFSALALARRFSPHPLLATLLFCATPAFVINGTSLEADVPFVALWLLSTALYVLAVDRNSHPLLLASSIAMALTALTAYQSILLVPILFPLRPEMAERAHRRLHTHRRAPGLEHFRAPLHRRASGRHSRELHDHLRSPGAGAKDQKRRRAHRSFGLAGLPHPLDSVALRAALRHRRGAFYDLNPLFWGSIAVGVGILIWCARHWRDFLAQWVLIFFAGALVIFFAGSARYLLPIALPIAILATQRAGRACSPSAWPADSLSASRSPVNYQHWDGYRQFARQLQPTRKIETALDQRRVGTSLLPRIRRRPPAAPGPGDPSRRNSGVEQTELSHPVHQRRRSAGARRPAHHHVIHPPAHRRAQGRAAYSTTMLGLRPFDISRAPIDQLSAELMIERKPTLTDLPMNAPQAEQQIVSGVYQLESGQWRWMSQTATILLKPPDQPAPVTVQLHHPRCIARAPGDHRAERSRRRFPNLLRSWHVLLSSPP